MTKQQKITALLILADREEVAGFVRIARDLRSQAAALRKEA